MKSAAGGSTLTGNCALGTHSSHIGAETDLGYWGFTSKIGNCENCSLGDPPSERSRQGCGCPRGGRGGSVSPFSQDVLLPSLTRKCTSFTLR